MKKTWKVVAAVATVVLFVFLLVFVVWASDAAPASEVALQSLNSDSQVYVSPENGWVIFFPAENARPETGFIFYPGGKVDYRAYAPVLKLISAKGYFVVLLPAPLNLAMFDINAAARVQAAYPEIQHWFVGGHSLGGVAAASFAAGREEIRGVVLWASAPGDDRLLEQGTPVLAVYGTNDGLFSQSMVDDSRALLPSDTQIVFMDGANHSQFGSYGFQAGDYEAGISPESQWSQTTEITVEFFETVSK
jgi:hypothetical protein